MLGGLTKTVDHKLSCVVTLVRKVAEGLGMTLVEDESVEW